jgi:hypothetical protein
MEATNRPILNRPILSPYIKSIVRRILQVLNSHFRQDVYGTIIVENLQLDEWRYPERINALIRM